MNERLKKLSFGFLIGIINGLLGAGGGMLAVPLLTKLGIDEKKAHATSIAIILPLSAISVSAYFLRENISFSNASIYLLPGAIGAIIGAWLLGKIPDKWLKRIFGAFMIWAGIRMMLK